MTQRTPSSKMPPPRRPLLAALCALIAVTLAHPQTTLAQSPEKPQAAPPKKTEAPARIPLGTQPTAKSQPPAQTAAPATTQTAGPPAAQQAAVPGAEIILVLIRSTLLRLNDALATGNFTVLRDLAAPSFAQANSAGRLYQIFASISAQGVDLSAVAVLVPQLPQPPALDPQGRLHIRGYFPGQPVQINFEMQFQAVDGQWRLFALSVAPAPAMSAVSATPAPGAQPGR